MAIYVKNSEEKEKLTSFLGYIEDELIAVRDLYRENMDDETYNKIVCLRVDVKHVKYDIVVDPDKDSGLVDKVDDLMKQGKNNDDIKQETGLFYKTIYLCRKLRHKDT